MKHPFFFEPFHEALLETLNAFIEQESPSWEDSALDARALTLASVKAMGRAGLLKLTVPKAYGGARQDIDSRALCLVREKLAFHSGVVDSAFAMQGLGAYPLVLGGSEAQKHAYLPTVAEGKSVVSFAITEPEAGSDAAHLTTRAERTPEGDYRIEGVKHLISNAGIADWYGFFARTGPDQGHRGVSAFILEGRLEGLRVIPQELMAEHVIGRLELSDVRIAGEKRLGEEGGGFKLAMQTLNRYRPTVGAAAVGMASRALDEALRYTNARRQFGRKLSEQQMVRAKLAELATELEAARLLVYQAAWIADHQTSRSLEAGNEGIKEAAMAKLHATESAWKIIDTALQLHGGIGLTRETTLEKLYRDVRPLRIYEGTSEIQKLVIASELLKSL